MNAGTMMKYKDWVVVGDVLNESKYASRILRALKNADYNTSGVNPRVESDEVYKSLKDVPFKIDIVDLCINPRNGIEIVKEAKELGIDKIMIQPGAESNEILNYCRENNIEAVQDCALVQLRKIGKL